MVQKSQALVLVPVALVILCLMLRSSNASLCSETFEGALKQTKRLIMHIERQAKQLYESYLTHQDLPSIATQFCHHNISWFPKRDITKKTNSKMLQRLHKTLVHMKSSLAVIREQQKDLNHEDASLHEELRRAHLSIRGLLQNTQCALLRLHGGPTATRVRPQMRPTPTSVFDVKLDGCRVLWNYSQFINDLAQAFRKQP